MIEPLFPPTLENSIAIGNITPARLEAIQFRIAPAPIAILAFGSQRSPFDMFIAAGALIASGWQVIFIISPIALAFQLTVVVDDVPIAIAIVVE